MKTKAILSYLILSGVLGHAQVASPPSVSSSARPAGSVMAPAGASDVGPLLTQVEQTAKGMNVDISWLRIQKWKADSAVKRQSQENADSISRNVTAALPSVIDQVRANPQGLAPSLKLYRNLNALYDVLAALTDSAGAYGSKSEYQSLANDASNLDRLRRALGDRLETLATATDTELVRLRTQAAQASAEPPAPPKKIIVDDEAKPKKTTPKKTTKKPIQDKAASTTGSSTPSPKP